MPALFDQYMYTCMTIFHVEGKVHQVSMTMAFCMSIASSQHGNCMIIHGWCIRIWEALQTCEDISEKFQKYIKKKMFKIYQKFVMCLSFVQMTDKWQISDIFWFSLFFKILNYFRNVFRLCNVSVICMSCICLYDDIIYAIVDMINAIHNYIYIYIYIFDVAPSSGDTSMIHTRCCCSFFRRYSNKGQQVMRILIKSTCNVICPSSGNTLYTQL